MRIFVQIPIKLELSFEEGRGYLMLPTYILYFISSHNCIFLINVICKHFSKCFLISSRAYFSVKAYRQRNIF